MGNDLTIPGADIASRIETVCKRIERAATASGRSARDVLLLAITKTVSIESISQAIAAGQRRFGENRVQEAEGKIRLFPENSGLEWHLVGHLQSNKARRAAEIFRVIHSVDNLKVARKLSQASHELGKSLSVLIQADLGGEETKFGVARDSVRELVEQVHPLKGLRLDGLMTIPPFFEDPNRIRPFFIELRELRDALESKHPGCLGERHLSMGMSLDFEIAVAEGATIVRIGTAIFGPREPG